MPSNEGSFLEYRPVICILDPSSLDISKVILDSREGILLTSRVLEVYEDDCSFCVVASQWKDRHILDSQSKIETTVVFKPYRMHFINNNYFVWTIDLCSIYAPFWISLRMPSIDTLLLWLSFLLQISDPLKFSVCCVVYILNLVLPKPHYTLMDIYRSKTNLSLCLRLIHGLFLFILCIQSAFLLCILKIWV